MLLSGDHAITPRTHPTSLEAGVFLSSSSFFVRLSIHAFAGAGPARLVHIYTSFANQYCCYVFSVALFRQVFRLR